MKALKLRIEEELYARFKALHPAYGEESQVFRELLEAYVKQQERKPHTCPKFEAWGVCGHDDDASGKV